MAPVDDKIAAARLERKKSMEQAAYEAGKMETHQAAVMNAGCDAEAYYPPTLAQQAEKSAQYHFEEQVKAQKAASFLQAHPEFDEFIRLVRAGSIQFIVFALCAISAFAQKPPVPTPTTPVLSTAERTAIQALEKQKQEAQQAYMQAQQNEVTIEQEFSVSHTGWRINPMSLAIEKEAPRTPAMGGPNGETCPPNTGCATPSASEKK